MNEVDDFLEHFGVKGMKWGVRNDRGGVSRKVDRDAKKDAEEFARAKMFYGTGAGTRRKLIKNTVEAKQKKDPDYAKAFERHLGNQDLSTHASKAKKERVRTDRTDRTKKQAGYLARTFTGEMGTQAAFAAVVVGGIAYLSSPNGQAKMKQASSKVLNAVNNEKAKRARNKGADFLSDYFQRNG